MTLTDQLQQLNTLNETKGQELAVLTQLHSFRSQAETESDWSMVVQSYWQEHLAHQHLVMNDQDPDGTHRTSMLSTAQSAHQTITDHQLTSLLGSSHRFLGRAYTYNQQHQQASENYQTAIKLLLQDQDPRYLEVQGFLCESMIRLGQTKEGLALAFQIFDSYDSDPLAQTLKTVDEYRYIVWRSGIFPRVVTALQELDVDYDKVKVKSYVEKSQQLISDQDKYAYRVAELKNTLSFLGIFLAYYLSLVPDLSHLPRL